MTKVLYTIGDSWTFGSDLDSPETECYPYLLSKKLDCDLINEGLPAASNDWMFRKTIEFRGASFLPFWITDLSQPDVIIYLPFNSDLKTESLYLKLHSFRLNSL